MQLIEINKSKYDISIDLKYASNDNIIGKQIFFERKCFLHPEAADKLYKACAIAKSLKYKLKIFDAYRPHYVQETLWNFNPDPKFLSDPEKGSPHTRGVAIDLTLTDLNGIELNMGTSFDDFSEKAFHLSSEISLKSRKYRAILLSIMTLAGFDFYHNEWWHYQLFNARKYKLIDKV